MTAPLHLQLDEVDMIAYASETQPVCSFYYDDSLDSDLTVERARTIVHRVNVHEQMLKALEAAESAINEAADIMLYEDDLPVTFLESREIEIAHGTLVTVMAEVQKAVRDGRSPTASRKKGKRS
jgi:hypothetical protein